MPKEWGGQSGKKGLLENIADWFRARRSTGIIGLLIGPGWVMVLLGSLYLGSQPQAPMGFYSMTAIGAFMVVSGVFLWYYIVKNGIPDCA